MVQAVREHFIVAHLAKKYIVVAPEGHYCVRYIATLLHSVSSVFNPLHRLMYFFKLKLRMF
jgi:hypothetical protein